MKREQKKLGVKKLTINNLTKESMHNIRAGNAAGISTFWIFCECAPEPVGPQSASCPAESNPNCTIGSCVTKVQTWCDYKTCDGAGGKCGVVAVGGDFAVM